MGKNVYETPEIFEESTVKIYACGHGTCNGQDCTVSFEEDEIAA